MIFWKCHVIWWLECYSALPPCDTSVAGGRVLFATVVTRWLEHYSTFNRHIIKQLDPNAISFTKFEVRHIFLKNHNKLNIKNKKIQNCGSLSSFGSLYGNFWWAKLSMGREAMSDDDSRARENWDFFFTSSFPLFSKIYDPEIYFAKLYM
jgi:hypothetical protein